uniref:Uncharacterized protein n=1 Tax=Tanacetum cinerariifolium TaxID=118510 RepID=A0A6L2N6P0_TANCI|nr:hypothetical protein [Tanacetum cinerariifolium]
MKPKEPTYQVVLDALALTTCYTEFLITVEVPVIYMHQFWATVNKHNASYRFKIDNKNFSVNVKVLRDILNICLRISGQEFVEPSSEEEALSFIRELSHSREIKYILDVLLIIYTNHGELLHQSSTNVYVEKYLEDLAYQINNIDSKKQDKMFYPRSMKIIIHYFLKKDKSISMRNKMFMHIAHDDSLLGTMRFISKHEDAQIYGAILPKAMTNQAMLDYVAYKTYYAIASEAKPPKSKKLKTKSNSAISSEETPSEKKPTKAKKDIPSKKKLNSKTILTKKKAPIKADRGKGDGTDLESGVPNEQHRKTSSADEGTGTKPRVPDVPEYDSEILVMMMITKMMTRLMMKKTDSDRTKSNKIKIPILNQSTTKYYKEEKEKVDDEEKMDEEDDEVTKKLYKDINVNLGNEDVDMTDVD